MSTTEARLDSIESRLRYLEDQERIRECLALYGYTADLGRSQAWVDLWTADGIYDLDDGPRKGREELTDLIAAPNGFHKSIENHCLHTVGNALYHPLLSIPCMIAKFLDMGRQLGDYPPRTSI
jgi:hypothetical protein